MKPNIRIPTVSQTAERLRQFIHNLTDFFGIPRTAPHASEQLSAVLGALLGIVCSIALTHAMVGPDATIWVVPSLGASAVLIFAAPHSLFAQPWAVLVGNISSALVGVACRLWVSDPTLAAAMAVALAIGIMHLGRCIHPPGGATALAAVIGGPTVHELGFNYALAPVGISCLLLVCVGLLFNCCFAWRRYPASLMRYVHVHPAPVVVSYALPNEEHILQAMERLNVVMDVSPTELREVIEQSMILATSTETTIKPTATPEFVVGRYYGSRHGGRHWSVRKIIARQPGTHADNEVLIYRIVEGPGWHREGSCSRAEFAQWAGREVQSRVHARKASRH